MAMGTFGKDEEENGAGGEAVVGERSGRWVLGEWMIGRRRWIV
jgi:hypothetical protein